MVSLKKTCSGFSPSLVDTWDRIFQNGLFSVREEVKSRSRDLERTVKWEMFVGKGGMVAVELVTGFQKTTTQSFSSLMQEEIFELWNRNVDEDILMEVGKYAIVLGRFKLGLKDYISKGNFIKGPLTYRIKLERIFRTVAFGAGKVLQDIFVLVSKGWKDEKRLWAPEVWLLFRMCGGRQEVMGSMRSFNL